MPVYDISSNSVQAAKFRIKFKDIFNMKEFYKAVREWLNEYGWSSVDATGMDLEGDEFWETNYIERVGPDGAKEHWWWWRLQKIPINNSYYKYHLDLDFHTLGVKDTEVMRDGKKFKANKGEVEVWGYAFIEFDVGGKWSKHPFLKYMNQIFPNRIMRKDIYEDRKLELYRETYTLQAFIKKWFKIKSFLPYEEITHFHPPHTYSSWKKE